MTVKNIWNHHTIHLEKVRKHQCVLTQTLLLIWTQLASGLCA
jgi:hypothetical protein